MTGTYRDWPLGGDDLAHFVTRWTREGWAIDTRVPPMRTVDDLGITVLRYRMVRLSELAVAVVG